MKNNYLCIKLEGENSISAEVLVDILTSMDNIVKIVAKNEFNFKLLLFQLIHLRVEALK